MGVDQSVFLGPFLKCKPKDMTVTETYRTCPDCNAGHGRKRRLHGNFCSEHGKGENITVEMPADSLQAIREIVETDFGDSLRILDCCGDPVIDGFACFCSNSQNGPGRDFDSSGPDPCVTEISVNDISLEIMNFRERFAKVIAEIERFCDSVEIKWGLIFTAN